MITQDQLKTIGLSTEEAAIYYALVHKGTLGLQAIARATNLKRTTLYPYVQSLVEKGIVSPTMHGKRTAYSAGSPVGLLQKLNESRYLLEAMLPQISQLLQTTESDQSVIVYRTIDELRVGIEKVVLAGDPNDELLTIEGDIPNMFRMGLPFWKELLAQKKKQGIRSRSLLADDEKTEFILHEHQVRLRVTSIIHGFQICLYIRGKQTLLYIPSQGTGVLLSNPAVASSLTLIFDGLWKKGRDINLSDL
ncbi:MAG: helix-turn-helix domain-containing protein [Patescibacteria group bacterium]